MHWHSATATTSLCRKAKCLAGFCSSELVHGSGLTWHNPKPNGKVWQLWAELVCSKQQGAGAAAQLPLWWWDRMRGCTAKKPGHRPWNDSLPDKIPVYGRVGLPKVWAQRGPVCLQIISSGSRSVPFPQPLQLLLVTLWWPFFRFPHSSAQVRMGQSTAMPVLTKAHTEQGHSYIQLLLYVKDHVSSSANYIYTQIHMKALMLFPLSSEWFWLGCIWFFWDILLIVIL